MNESYTVGGHVDAWCTKCKLELGHTIVALVENAPKRVKCNTCNGLHNYRLKPEEKKTTSRKRVSRVKKTPEAIYNEHLEQVTGGSDFNTRRYNFQENFEKDEIIEHPRFGTGIVLTVLNANKMEILFKEGPKLLIQNK